MKKKNVVLLVKEGIETKTVSRNIMLLLGQVEKILDAAEQFKSKHGYRKKVHLIKALRIASAIQDSEGNGSCWGLRECKIFIEDNFDC